MIRYFRGPGQRGPSLSTLLNKIELASGFEN